MTNRSLGLWLVGAWGGVATTAAVGLAGLQQELVGETALVTALPLFADLDLAKWRQFIVGGHEIRETTFLNEARAFAKISGVFSESLLANLQPTLDSFDANIRPGTLHRVGQTIERLATSWIELYSNETALETIDRLSNDLSDFRERHQLKHVIVVNVASTEPSLNQLDVVADWATLSKALETSTISPVPASSLYAIAAMQSGCSYINFTPSLGSTAPALQELAIKQGVLHAGCDGKTGETLMKSVLGPMFAARNLNVLSWVGHNIFGNRDGQVLDDPVNKASKIRSKDQQLSATLGYQPQSLVSIEFIESLGDWKTAWDHIHFEGFLGTKMTLQFTWQGCDSILAAPLVLDLARLTEREWRRGASGVMTHLAAFFKSPINVPICGFATQHDALERWVAEAVEQSS